MVRPILREFRVNRGLLRLAALGAIVGAVALSACAPAAAPAAPAAKPTTAPAAAAKPAEGAAKQEQLEIKLSMSQQPSDPLYQALEKFAKLVDERSQGTIKVALFGSNQLGGEKDVIDGMKLGNIQAGAMGYTGGKTYDAIYLPYLFRDADHYWKVHTGPVGEELSSMYQKEVGLRVWGYFYRNPRLLTTTKREVRTPEDLKGFKIRVPENQIMMGQWKNWGASPTPMAMPELFTALQQGAVDGQENPAELIYSMGYNEVQKYLVLTEHNRSTTIGVMNDKTWQKMTPENQKMWRETALEIANEHKARVMSEEKDTIKTMQEKGMVVIEPDVEAFKAGAKDFWKDWAPKSWGDGFYEKIQAVQ